MSDPNQPTYDPYQQPPSPGVDPYYGGHPPNTLPYNTPAMAPRRPVSPMVLGIIGIIYAGHNTLCMGSGLLIPLIGGDRFADWIAGFGTMTPEQVEQMKAQMTLTPWMFTQLILWIVLGIICWIGSIGSFMRAEKGRIALLNYALGFLLLGLLSHGIEAAQGFPALKAQTQMQSTSGGFAMPLEALVAMTLGCAAVFAVYPICVLWFYTRPAVKAWFRREQPAVSPEAMYYGQ